jgi:ribosomal protein S18 acetylase RimI-like enzyme
VGVEVLVREARAADANELARLRWDFRVEEQSGQSVSEFLTQFQEWFAAALVSKRWIVVVAERKLQGLCGCMYLQCIEKVPSPGSSHAAWGYLTNCYVAEEHRRTGIGSRLIRFVVDLARSRRLEFISVWPSETSVSFYKRAGFKSVSEIHTGIDDEPPLELIL